MGSRTDRGIVLVEGIEEPNSNEVIVRDLNEQAAKLFKKHQEEKKLPEDVYDVFLAKVNELNALPKHSFKSVFPDDEVLKDKLQIGRPFAEYKNCPLFEICGEKFFYKGEINSNKQPDGRGVLILPGNFILAGNFKNSVVTGNYFLLNMTGDYTYISKNNRGGSYNQKLSGSYKLSSKHLLQPCTNQVNIHAMPNSFISVDSCPSAGNWNNDDKLAW